MDQAAIKFIIEDAGGSPGAAGQGGSNVNQEPARSAAPGAAEAQAARTRSPGVDVRAGDRLDELKGKVNEAVARDLMRALEQVPVFGAIASAMRAIADPLIRYSAAADKLAAASAAQAAAAVSLRDARGKGGAEPQGFAGEPPPVQAQVDEGQNPWEVQGPPKPPMFEGVEPPPKPGNPAGVQGPPVPADLGQEFRPGNPAAVQGPPKPPAAVQTPSGPVEAQGPPEPPGLREVEAAGDAGGAAAGAAREAPAAAGGALAASRGAAALGTVAIVAGAVAGVFVALAGTAKLLDSALLGAVSEFEGFSGVLAAEAARQRALSLINRVENAQAIGDSLAKFVEARGNVERTLDDAKTGLLDGLARISEPWMNIINGLSERLGGTTQAVSLIVQLLDRFSPAGPGNIGRLLEDILRKLGVIGENTKGAEPGFFELLNGQANAVAPPPLSWNGRAFVGADGTVNGGSAAPSGMAVGAGGPIPGLEFP